MKLLLILTTAFFLNTDSAWLTNFEQAKKIANEKHQYILLNFSGSDWCGPCMRLRKDIFESTDFKSFSSGHLVLVNADFPRSKKNKLSKEQQMQNDNLAEKYNPEGKFPYTVLLTESGNLVKGWIP
jgi:thioredoxin-related protein